MGDGKWETLWDDFKAKTTEWVIESLVYEWRVCCPGHAGTKTTDYLITQMKLDTEYIVARVYEIMSEDIANSVTIAWREGDWIPKGKPGITLEGEIKRATEADMKQFMDHMKNRWVNER